MTLFAVEFPVSLFPSVLLSSRAAHLTVSGPFPPQVTGSSQPPCCLPLVPSTQWLLVTRHHLVSSLRFLFLAPSYTQPIKSCPLRLQSVSQSRLISALCGDPQRPSYNPRPRFCPPSTLQPGARSLTTLESPVTTLMRKQSPNSSHDCSRTFTFSLQCTFSTFITYLSSVCYMLPVSRMPFLSYSPWKNPASPEGKATWI